MVIYYDELTPGDAFAADNKRKFWTIYVAFREFGPAMLAQEEVWLPMGILRTSLATKTIVGGMANATRLLLGSICGRAIMVKGVNEGELISVGSIINLADLDAHRCVSGWKGTSGLRPCTKCRNCMCKGHKSCTATSWQIDITCKDFAKFDLATDEDIYETLDMLQLAYDNGQEVDVLEKAHGLNRDPYSMYMDMALRPYLKPVSGIKYDPMHTMYQNGVFSYGISLFLHALRKVGKRRFSDIDAYFAADWKCPEYCKRSFDVGRKMWTTKREDAMNRKKDKLIKANASEQLAIYPILRRVAADIAEVNEAMVPHCECFASLCDLADALQDAKFQRFKDRKQMHDKLMFLAVRYLTLSSRLYGESHTKPKAHILFHIINDFLEDGYMFDCWVLERMNLLPKKHAVHICMTRKFERSVLLRTVRTRSEQLRNMEFTNQLVNGMPSKSMSAQLGVDVELGTGLRMLSGLKLARNDVIFVGEDRDVCCIVKACFKGNRAISNGAYAVGILTEQLAFQEQVGDDCSKWRRLFKGDDLMAT